MRSQVTRLRLRSGKEAVQMERIIRRISYGGEGPPFLFRIRCIACFYVRTVYIRYLMTRACMRDYGAVSFRQRQPSTP